MKLWTKIKLARLMSAEAEAEAAWHMYKRGLASPTHGDKADFMRRWWFR